jgi:hypothetical protein
MAICYGCGQEMYEHVGCDVTWILFDDGRYERVRYGDEDGDWGAKRGKLCGDCGVPPFTFHHPDATSSGAQGVATSKSRVGVVTECGKTRPGAGSNRNDGSRGVRE